MVNGQWLEAAYYNDFKCKCGECRTPCCTGWKIAVKEDEYYSLIGLDCSENLHNRLEASFSVPDFPDKYRYRMIEPNWQGQCRMLDEDGLCMLQKECGEERIPELCRVYPRSLKSQNGLLKACCTASCEAVTELLLKTEALTFIAENKSLTPEIVEQAETGAEVFENTALEMIRNREMSLEQRIVAICRYILFDGKESENVKAIEVVSNIDTPEKLKEIIGLLEHFVEESESLRSYYELIKERYDNETGFIQYSKDLIEFEGKVPMSEQYFENLICNNIFYSDFPYTDARLQWENSCYGLVLQYAILKLVCVSHMTVDDSYEAFVDAIAAVYHLVEHTSFYFNAYVLKWGIKKPKE